MGLLVFTLASLIVGASVLKLATTRNFTRRVKGDILPCEEGKSGQGTCTVKEKLNTHPDAQGVFAISLFGDLSDPEKYKRYAEPVLNSADKVKGLIDGWYLRVYAAPNLPRELIDLLVSKDVEVYIMANIPRDFEGSMWRFLPAGEDIAFTTLDADDEITEKYGGMHSLANLVQKWSQTDRPFFQRALYHVNIFVPISAGMWGSKGKAIPDIEQKIERYCADWFGCDEAFLTREVWPEFKTKGVYRSGNPMELIFLLALVIMAFLALNYVLYEMMRTKNNEVLK